MECDLGSFDHGSGVAVCVVVVVFLLWRWVQDQQCEEERVSVCV